MARKWTYSYKTSDGQWHEGLIEAGDRDAAYAAIKATGIRPAKVTELVPPVVRIGFRGLCRRDWALIGASAIVLVLAVWGVAVLLGGRAASLSKPQGVPATARARHQIEFMPRDFPHRLSSVFKFNSERFLALYAQPGMPRSFLDGGKWLPSLDENPPKAIEFSLNDLLDALDSEILIYPNDPRWLAELKRVVVGMKDEAGTLLKSGKGAEEIALWLDARNKMEASYREEAIRKVKSGEQTAESADFTLRTMGLKGLPK